MAFSVDASARASARSAAGAVSFTGAGTCIIDANQAGTATYNAAPQVQQTFTVGKGSQTITFTSTAPTSATVGGATYTPTATATSGLTVPSPSTRSSRSVCSISGGRRHLHRRAAPASSTPTRPATATTTRRPRSSRPSPSAKGSQTISFTSTARRGHRGRATYTADATATSGLTVTFTVDASSTGSARSAAGVVTFTGPAPASRRQPGRQRQLQRGAPGPADLHGRQGQPDDHLHLDRAGAARSAGPPTPPTATATSGITVTFTVGLDLGLHVVGHQRHGRHLRRGRDLHHRRQPGRERQLRTRRPGPADLHGRQGHQTITFTSTAPVGDRGRGHLHPDGHGHLGLTGHLLDRRLELERAARSAAGRSPSPAPAPASSTPTRPATPLHAAPQVQQTFTVGKGSQTITFTSTAADATVVGGPPTRRRPRRRQGITVTFSIELVDGLHACARISAAVVTFSARAPASSTPTRPATATTNAAPQVQQTFTVAKAQPDHHLHLDRAHQRHGRRAPTPATATGDLGPDAVTITVDSIESACAPSRAASSPSSARHLHPRRQPGRQRRLQRRAPRSSRPSRWPRATRPSSFTSTAPASATVGGATYTPAATATSGLTVAITVDSSSSSVCTISGGVVTFIAAGTCTLDANQAGNGTYERRDPGPAGLHGHRPTRPSASPRPRPPPPPSAGPPTRPRPPPPRASRSPSPSTPRARASAPSRVAWSASRPSGPARSTPTRPATPTYNAAHPGPAVIQRRSDNHERPVLLHRSQADLQRCRRNRCQRRYGPGVLRQHVPLHGDPQNRHGDHCRLTDQSLDDRRHHRLAHLWHHLLRGSDPGNPDESRLHVHSDTACTQCCSPDERHWVDRARATRQPLHSQSS